MRACASRPISTDKHIPCALRWRLLYIIVTVTPVILNQFSWNLVCYKHESYSEWLQSQTPVKLREEHSVSSSLHPETHMISLVTFRLDRVNNFTNIVYFKYFMYMFVIFCLNRHVLNIECHNSLHYMMLMPFLHLAHSFQKWHIIFLSDRGKKILVCHSGRQWKMLISQPGCRQQCK